MKAIRNLITAGVFAISAAGCAASAAHGPAIGLPAPTQVAWEDCGAECRTQIVRTRCPQYAPAHMSGEYEQMIMAIPSREAFDHHVGQCGGNTRVADHNTPVYGGVMGVTPRGNLYGAVGFGSPGGQYGRPRHPTQGEPNCKLWPGFERVGDRCEQTKNRAQTSSALRQKYDRPHTPCPPGELIELKETLPNGGISTARVRCR